VQALAQPRRGRFLATSRPLPGGFLATSGPHTRRHAANRRCIAHRAAMRPQSARRAL